MIEPIRWADGALVLLDQRLLPGEETYLRLTRANEVVAAIRDLVVRGAPAIGVSAAYGLVLAAQALPDDEQGFVAGFEDESEHMLAARPTAVNLAWAVRRMRRAAAEAMADGVAVVRERLLREAVAMQLEDVAANRAMGRHGADLLPPQAGVLTHCNAGALATAGYGTALGVVRAARELGNEVRVIADETRPFLQGSRLTAWEMQQDGIPCTVITDSMAGHMMRTGAVDVVVVGADRVAANGDVANKIGTYSVAVLARENDIPFYVAAPTSTIDLEMACGDDIPIEQRDGEEVLMMNQQRLAPEGVPALYPAFDITPNRLVDAIITERGVARAPFRESLRARCQNSES